MKHLFIPAILLLTTAVGSCKKADENTQTKVNIVVKDAIGITRSNFTVYQIDDQRWNSFGDDPFFADQQSVTDNNGLATFEINKAEFTGGGQKTYYFFCTYSIAGVNKKKDVGITLKKGDTQSGTLVLN